jgi:hypothetical protein
MTTDKPSAAGIRKAERIRLTLPLLMRDPCRVTPYKAVVLDVSSRGIRGITNDRSFINIPLDQLRKIEFTLDFDFFDVPTMNIKGKVLHVRPTRYHPYEITLGIQFTSIPREAATLLNRKILALEATAQAAPQSNPA